jgi:hypothetical protein
MLAASYCFLPDGRAVGAAIRLTGIGQVKLYSGKLVKRIAKMAGRLLVLLVGLMGVSLTAPQDSAKQDMKDAGHDTKEAAKDAGRATQKAAKKTGHTVKKTTQSVTHKAAQKTDEGAKKVEDKTKPE